MKPRARPKATPLAGPSLLPATLPLANAPRAYEFARIESAIQPSLLRR
jgi:hypothetical protein